jgi:hypothetical protein
MKIKEYVLNSLVEKILNKSIDETNEIIDEKLGRLARNIMDEDNNELKEMFIEQYNSLKKINKYEIDSITLEDIPLETLKVIHQKINSIID